MTAMMTITSSATPAQKRTHSRNQSLVSTASFLSEGDAKIVRMGLGVEVKEIVMKTKTNFKMRRLERVRRLGSLLAQLLLASIPTGLPQATSTVAETHHLHLSYPEVSEFGLNQHTALARS